MSRGFYGNVQVGATVNIPWATNDGNGASVTRATDGTISVYKDNSATQVTTGVTDTEDFDSLTGVHLVTIDTSTDSDFYSTGSMFHVVLSAATIDGQTVNHPIASFAIGEMIGVTSTAADNADNVALVNRALSIMGEESIDSLADSNKRAEVANLLLVPARDSTLELHNWKSARKLTTLTQDTTYTATAGSWSASVATITFASHSIESGDSVTVAGFVPTGYNGTYTVTGVTATTITYALTTDPGTVTTLGTVLDPLTPDWKFDRQFSMPSDFIRLVGLEDQSSQYEIHGDKMVTTMSEVNMEYVYRLTDVSAMGPMLKESISAKLAHEMSFRLDTSSSKHDRMEKYFDRTLALARNVDASQRPNDRMEADEWLLGRQATTSNTFNRLGPVPTP